jgi:hypothetical protein
MIHGLKLGGISEGAAYKKPDGMTAIQVAAGYSAYNRGLVANGNPSTNDVLVGLIHRDKILRKGTSSCIELTGLHSFRYINKGSEQRELAEIIRIGDRRDSDSKVFQPTHTLDSGSSNKGQEAEPTWPAST